MSLEALSAKRIRRQWEPEEKTWHDDALDLPWEDLEPALHKTTVFVLKNVFFFSHATPVQARAIGKLTASGNSAIVEAPTGSGKTLAFLIPLMERTMRACEAFVAAHQRPPLTRNILGVILSPSRTLAEQTFVVAKSLAARYPFNVQFALCDGVVEKAPHVVSRLKHNTRGAGSFIVTTPKDFVDVLALLEGATDEGAASSAAAAAVPEEEDMEALLAAQDEQTRRRYVEKKRRLEAEGKHPTTARRKGLTKASVAPVPAVKADQTVRFHSSAENRFVLVVDEADLVFNSPEMREIVMAFIRTHCNLFPEPTPSKKVSEQSPKGKGKKKKSTPTKRAREDSPAAESEAHLLLTDFAFVGATVATSHLVHQYAKDTCAAAHTTLHLIAARSHDDFISQLQNRYLVCDAYNFLPFLIQMMNLHASKKHFVFFNNFRALLFVQKLFTALSQGPRPLLFVKDVYTMYEGMTENARIEQYNSFLTHVSSSTAAENAAREKARKEKRNLSDVQKRNQIFTGGWKRDGKAPMGSGAILLCTDIAAFGLDVRDVDYVYHFEPPATVRSYVHRVGRVGRMGMKGSSILLLPCIASGHQQVVEHSRERKSNSTRFNTVTNTKASTVDLQAARMSVDDLSEERRQYIDDLAAHSALEEYSLPPFAPIASTLRNLITQDDKLLKLAKSAAVSMCAGGSADEKETQWFTPKLALRALLLD